MTTQRTINPATGALWASAFVIAALVIMQAGKLPANAAFAEMTAESGGYTLMTTNAGRGGENGQNYELLYVLDDRTETLLVYEVENATAKRILLRQFGPLEALPW